jgi:hypothetical protein
VLCSNSLRLNAAWPLSRPLGGCQHRFPWRIEVFAGTVRRICRFAAFAGWRCAQYDGIVA